MPLCHACGIRDIPSRNRRYCAECSPRASAIWKARNRRAWKHQWKQGETTVPPRLDGWNGDVDRYRAYHREYMKRRRAERPTGGTPLGVAGRGNSTAGSSRPVLSVDPVPHVADPPPPVVAARQRRAATASGDVGQRQENFRRAEDSEPIAGATQPWD